MTTSSPGRSGPEQASPGSTADSGPDPVLQRGTENGPSGTGAGLVRLTDLLGTRREISILHGDAVYTLRLTSNNRLILTK
ncbi:hemin uptake protein HemP [Novispirillum itersonii]|uniref:hemin uptake protein HemP n=1 Tax=Novispirillum itersonii TaxID=189 RepID=UPI000373DB8B|nr:hemin uptake protein HemP [Novispirillum itersonii]